MDSKQQAAEAAVRITGASDLPAYAATDALTTLIENWIDNIQSEGSHKGRVLSMVWNDINSTIVALQDAQRQLMTCPESIPGFTDAFGPPETRGGAVP